MIIWNFNLSFVIYEIILPKKEFFTNKTGKNKNKKIFINMLSTFKKKKNSHCTLCPSESN